MAVARSRPKELSAVEHYGRRHLAGVALLHSSSYERRRRVLKLALPIQPRSDAA